MFRNLLIAIAIFGLGWGASFGAGMAVGKRSAPAVVQAASVGAQGGQAPNGLAQAGAGAAAQGGQSRVALGTVSNVNGQTLTVSAQNGQDVKVNLTGQTQITKQTAATPADLVSGARVAVQAQGQPAADGSITAASVSIVPEGAAVPAQRQQGGQGGQAGGQRPPGQQGG